MRLKILLSEIKKSTHSLAQYSAPSVALHSKSEKNI